MQEHGSQTREECPVCGALDLHRNYWRIPYAPIDPLVVIAGARTNKAPILDDDCIIYSWARCEGCGTVFMDPFNPSVESYRTRTSHADRFKDNRPPMEGGYLGRWNHISSYFKSEYKSFLDAACGAGQYLWQAVEDEAHDWERVEGLELAAPSVDAINTAALLTDKPIRAYTLDLGELPLPTKYDFVVFSEAAEHVEYPRVALRTLVGGLNPGGRIYFTFQSPAGGLPIRPAEPIYATEKGVRGLCKDLGLALLDFKLSSGRWTVVAER